MKDTTTGWPGLGTWCSVVASIVTPFTSPIGSMRGVGKGTSGLRLEIVGEPVIAATFAMVVYDNAPEDEGAMGSHFLREHGV